MSKESSKSEPLSFSSSQEIDDILKGYSKPEDVDIADAENRRKVLTAFLMRGIFTRNPTMISSAIRGGADVNAFYKKLKTKEELAKEEGIYDRGILGQHQWSALDMAMSYVLEENRKGAAGDPNVVRKFIAPFFSSPSSIAMVRHRYSNASRSPLHRAVSAGLNDVVQIFLQYGNTVNLLTENYVEGTQERISLLHLAASKGYRDTTSLLLASGADTDQPNHENETPLNIAVRKKDWDMVDEFLKCGAAVREDNNEKSPLTGIESVDGDHRAIRKLKVLKQLKIKFDYAMRISREPFETDEHFQVKRLNEFKKIINNINSIISDAIDPGFNASKEEINAFRLSILNSEFRFGSATFGLTGTIYPGFAAFASAQKDPELLKEVLNLGGRADISGRAVEVYGVIDFLPTAKDESDAKSQRNQSSSIRKAFRSDKFKRREEVTEILRGEGKDEKKSAAKKEKKAEGEIQAGDFEDRVLPKDAIPSIAIRYNSLKPKQVVSERKKSEEEVEPDTGLEHEDERVRFHSGGKAPEKIPSGGSDQGRSPASMIPIVGKKPGREISANDTSSEDEAEAEEKKQKHTRKNPGASPKPLSKLRQAASAAGREVE